MENKEQISFQNDVKDILIKAIQEKDYTLLQSIYLNNPIKKEEHKFIFEFISQETYLKNDFIINLKGYCYENGIGVKKNYKKAIQLYNEAIQMNNSYAYNNLGNLYFTGIKDEYGFVLEKDIKKAIELYEKAAQLNNSIAINNLGYCYLHGIGVEKDYKKAFELFEKAIKKNLFVAIKNLGYCYEYGCGVVKDYNKALELYYQYHILTERNIDHIIKRIIDKNPSIMITLLSLKKENEELKKENDHLRDCPGLSYQEAKAHFEILKESLFYKKIENNS